jgi:hypothetical protein
MIHPRAAGILFLFLIARVSVLAAQDCVTPLPGSTRPITQNCYDTSESRFGAHLTTLGLNVALGAATAGVTSHFRGNSFWKGLFGGAIGGGLSYSGKRIVSADFYGSGFLGRQVNAVGASIAANSTTGAGVLDNVSLALGPMRLDVQLKNEFSIHPRVDVPNLAYALYTASVPNVDLDLSESVSSGATVFIDRSEAVSWRGRHAVGVIIVKSFFPSDNSPEEWHRVQKHETIHLLQHDFTSLAWSRPTEEWLSRQMPGAAKLHQYADFRLDIFAWEAMRRAVPHHDRPSEREAYFHTGPGE